MIWRLVATSWDSTARHRGVLVGPRPAKEVRELPCESAYYLLSPASTDGKQEGTLSLRDQPDQAVRLGPAVHCQLGREHVSQGSLPGRAKEVGDL
jgi:hypothetical protein